jgi:8-oxo-dGTP diphosphatase
VGIIEMDFYDLPKSETFLVTQRALIINEKNKILLLRTAFDVPGWKGRWGLPGGLVEINETLGGGLKREVFEETGLKVKAGDLIGVNDYWLPRFEFKDGRVKRARFVVLTYQCQPYKGKVRLSEEHDQFMWTSRDEIKGLKLAPDSKPIFDRLLALG